LRHGSAHAHCSWGTPWVRKPEAGAWRVRDNASGIVSRSLRHSSSDDLFG
jgi:hypothetical protein